jgi:hypothetical protein
MLFRSARYTELMCAMGMPQGTRCGVPSGAVKWP